MEETACFESFDERRYPLRIITLALSLPAIVLCLSIHETARRHAPICSATVPRVIPVSNADAIDPIGFLCLLLLASAGARPVLVNIANFRNRR